HDRLGEFEFGHTNILCGSSPFARQAPHGNLSARDRGAVRRCREQPAGPRVFEKPPPAWSGVDNTSEHLTADYCVNRFLTVPIDRYLQEEGKRFGHPSSEQRHAGMLSITLQELARSPAVATRRQPRSKTVGGCLAACTRSSAS